MIFRSYFQPFLNWLTKYKKKLQDILNDIYFNSYDFFLEMTCDLMTTDLLYYVNFETYHTKKLWWIFQS